MSPTDRASSTGPMAPSWAASTFRNGRCSSCSEGRTGGPYSCSPTIRSMRRGYRPAFVDDWLLAPRSGRSAATIRPRLQPGHQLREGNELVEGEAGQAVGAPAHGRRQRAELLHCQRGLAARLELLVIFDLHAALRDVAGVDAVELGAAAQSGEAVDLDPRQARLPAIVEHRLVGQDLGDVDRLGELDADVRLLGPDDLARRLLIAL